MLILAPKGASYTVVTETTVTRPPIRVLNTKSHGWHDIAVQVAGGGIQGFEAILSFDGKTYPANPSSVQPDRQSDYGKAQGKIAISATSHSEPLYLDEVLTEKPPNHNTKLRGTETIVPGESVGNLHLGMRKDDSSVSWQTKPDLTIPRENSCKDTELHWFDNESGSPGVEAYVANGTIYEITSNWDERFKIEEVGLVFGMKFSQLKGAMPDGELLRLQGSDWEWPSQRDEFFWVIPANGIAFGLNYPLEMRPQQISTKSERIVQSVTVFRPQNGFQPRGCANPDQPLVPVEGAIE